MQAVTEHMKHPDRGQFFPKPADLVRILRGSVKSQALQAWTLAVNAMFEHGQYASVTFTDPIINHVIIDMGGWPGFCDWPDREWDFKKQEFCQRYEGHMGRPLPAQHLPGLHELDNRGQFDGSVPAVITVGKTPRAIEGS